MTHLLEGVDTGVELGQDISNTLKVVLLKSSELLDSAEQLDELGDSSAEKFKFAEDLVGRELKLFSLWHAHQPFLGKLVLLLVGTVELEAALEDLHVDRLRQHTLHVEAEDLAQADALVAGLAAAVGLGRVQAGVHLLGVGLK